MPLSKVPLQLSCKPFSSTERLQWGLPAAFSSAGWTSPTLSALPQRRGVPALWWFLWLFSGPAPTGPRLSCIVLLNRAALNPFSLQPVLILGIAHSQVLDLALGLVEPHEVHIDPLLDLVQVPPDGILSLRHVDHTTQLGVTCRLAEGALDSAIFVIDKYIKQYWSLYRSLRDTTRHWSLIQPLTPSCWTLPSECNCPNNSLSTKQSTQ